MHDQEKSYSPALKRLGEREDPERRRQEEWEQDKKEKCRMKEMFYDECAKYLEGKESSVAKGTTIDEVNEFVREMNDKYARYGCPALPEFEPRLPTFAAKF
jgi:hypothetical protein